MKSKLNIILITLVMLFACDIVHGQIASNDHISSSMTMTGPEALGLGQSDTVSGTAHFSYDNTSNPASVQYYYSVTVGDQTRSGFTTIAGGKQYQWDVPVTSTIIGDGSGKTEITKGEAKGGGTVNPGSTVSSSTQDTQMNYSPLVVEWERWR